MGNIISILYKFFPFIVFLLLEFFAFLILSKSNDYHKTNVINQLNYISGGFHQKRNYFLDYFNLKSKNEALSEHTAQLLKENFRLKNLLLALNTDTAVKPNFNLSDSSRTFQPILAQVVFNTISKSRNYFIINKGKLHGVEEDMGIISPNGPVGLTVACSDNYTTCMSILNEDANLSAKVKGTNYIGIIKWRGPNIQLATLDDFPKHIKLTKGQIIETSGHSTFFPAGIQIGKVVSQQIRPDRNFAEVTIEFSTDFSSIDRVFVLKNHHKKELSSVIKQLDSIDSKINSQQ